MFYDVLQSEPIRLIFEFALVPVHDRSDANLRHEQACIADKRARRNSGDDQANPLAARFFHFAPLMHLQDMSNFVAEDERELRFVIDGAQQPSVDEHRTVRQRGCIDGWIFDNEEPEFQRARRSLYA